MSEHSGVERELKFQTGQLDRIRQWLQAHAGERLAAGALEENWVFDREDELRQAGCLLRLRSDAHGARLTFKGPPRWEGSLKLRVEREVGVAEAAATRALLESLGYRVVRRYQKIREEWRVAETLVALDHTPIGDFVEFEGESAEEIARRCGLDPRQAERRNYLQLYQDHRLEHPEAPQDMIFP